MPPPKPMQGMGPLYTELLVDLCHNAGTHRAAALADSEAQAFLDGNRVISSTSMVTLSPGMHISVPSGRLITPVTSVVRK